MLHYNSFIKLTTKDNNHNGFIFKEGLNTDPIPLNNKNCEEGGIYFTDWENWTDWVTYNKKVMYWMWDCEPVGEVLIFKEYRKYKAQSVILSNPRCFWRNYDFQVDLIDINGKYIQYITNPCEIIQLMAVEKNVNFIEYIKYPYESVQIKVVEKDPYLIQYFKNPSEAVQLAAVKKDGLVIQWINKAITEVVQMATIEQNYKAITEVVQLAAVEQNYKAIRFIANPSEAVRQAAIKQNENAIKWIEDYSENNLEDLAKNNLSLFDDVKCIKKISTDNNIQYKKIK